MALALALVVGPIAPPSSAVAAKRDPKAAEAQFRRARREASQGNYATALRHLQRAYSADPLPKYVANQGVAYLKMKQYAEAVERFEWFLERVDAPDDRALAESWLLKLRPQVIITSDPPGARVRVDQAPWGETPLITELLAGEHLLEFDLDGYRPASRPLVIELNEGMTLHVDLEVDPLARMAEKTLEPPPTPEPAAVTTRTLQPAGDGWGADEWGWLSIAIGGAAVAAGATLGALAFRSLDARADAVTVAQWQTRQSDAESYGIGMYAAGGAGLAALITGVILLAIDGDAPSVRADGHGVSVGGRF